jgi:hypothetical protein
MSGINKSTLSDGLEPFSNNFQYEVPVALIFPFLPRELPPVLNLQLNRFQFDMQYNRKKKLNSVLYFPDVLDMGEYLDDKSKVSVRFTPCCFIEI